MFVVMLWYVMSLNSGENSVSLSWEKKDRAIMN